MAKNKGYYTCKKCSTVVSEKATKCPGCNSDLSAVGRNINIRFVENIKVLDLLGLKRAGEEKFSKKHKYISETIVGKRLGKDGKVAYVHQIIDREKNYYKKFVMQGRKIIKDIEGKLSSHRGSSNKP